MNKAKILKHEVYDSQFGKKIINTKTGQLGLIIKTWNNVFADATIPFVTWVDIKGKRHNSPMKEIAEAVD